MINDKLVKELSDSFCNISKEQFEILMNKENAYEEFMDLLKFTYVMGICQYQRSITER